MDVREYTDSIMTRNENYMYICIARSRPTNKLRLRNGYIVRGLRRKEKSRETRSEHELAT